MHLVGYLYEDYHDARSLEHKVTLLVGSTACSPIIKMCPLPQCAYVLQTDEQEVITFLLTTEIIPLCLRIMESGSELSKTVATFILQKILLDDSGLSYICQTYDRFSHVAMILVGSALYNIVIVS